MTLIDRIETAMTEDTDSRAKQSAYLESLYEESDAKGRELLDAAMVCVTGYTLGRLMHENGDEDEE